MQVSDNAEFQQAVLERLDNNDKFQQAVLERLDKLAVEVDGLKQELALTNVRVDTYQKASTQVVNWAFGLITTATVTIIVTSVLK